MAERQQKSANGRPQIVYPDPPPPWLDHFAEKRLDYHAERLARKYHLGKDDEQDIRQELFLRVFRKQRHYDPERSSYRTFTSNAFVWAAKVIERDLCRDRTRAKRLWAARRILIQRASRRRGACPSPGASTEVAELFRAIDRLPHDQRELAMRLMTGMPTEAARSLGVNRSTVYRRLGHLREALGSHAPHECSPLPATV